MVHLLFIRHGGVGLVLVVGIAVRVVHGLGVVAVVFLGRARIIEAHGCCDLVVVLLDLLVHRVVLGAGLVLGIGVGHVLGGLGHLALLDGSLALLIGNACDHLVGERCCPGR